MLLSAEKIEKGYGVKPLLFGVDFYLNEGDKVGVIGVNGTGKSTFLRILAGMEHPDSGTVNLGKDIRISYLSQNPDFQNHEKIIDYVLCTKDGKKEGLKEYEAKSILNKLGILEFDKDLSLLSGGEKKKVSIGKALVEQSDVLILDEPTNHLDNDMILWLEQYLINYKGAIIMITHDRYFLNRVTNKIIEIDQGNLYRYDANYSTYLELKSMREDFQAGSMRKKQSLLKRELAWMQQGIKARGTRNRGRVERYEDLKEKTKASKPETLEMSSMASRLGKKTIEINHISKAYEGKILISDFEYIILRGERLGIIGNNGCGKSTLLNMIMGNILPDSGDIQIGDTVKIGYFSQDNSQMDTSLKVLDYIRNIGENILTEDGTITASQMLERFLFSPDLQHNVIARLSGGEKRRLFLLGILMSAPNILLLDEPTNDLDIETLTILEDYLDHFQGGVVAVSHDRYFLDRMAKRVLVFENQGNIALYNGGYSDYMQVVLEDETKTTTLKAEKNTKDKSWKEESTSVKKKMSYNEQREFDTIEDDIAALEEKIATIETCISKETTNYDKLQNLLKEKEEAELALEHKMQRWIYFTEKLEEI